MTQRARPGEDLRIDYDAWNFVLDQYQKNSGVGLGASKLQPKSANDTRMLVQNITGIDLPRFAIVGYGSPVFAPPILSGGVAADGTDGDYENGAFDTYCLQATLPSGDLYKWGVLQEPIADQEFGQCLVSGVTWVKVQTSTSNPYAVPIAGNSDHLTGVACGICRALFFPANKTDPQWWLVNIG